MVQAFDINHEDKFFIYEFLTTIVNSKESRCHILCRRLCICVLLIAVVVLAASIIFYDEPRVCTTKECLRSATAFQQSMDPNVDPCDDFYGYVCGKWAETHPRPDFNGKFLTQHSWGNELQIKLFYNIRDHLELNVTQSDPRPVRQAKIMYQACKNFDESDKKYEKVIENSLIMVGLPVNPTLLQHSELASKHPFDWIAIVASIRRRLGLDVLIRISVESDENDELFLMLDSQPDVGTKFNRLREKYNISFSELPNQHDEYEQDEEKYIRIWHKYIDELFVAAPESKPLEEEILESFSAANKTSFKTLLKVLSEQPPELIELYIWDAVDTFFRKIAKDKKRNELTCSMIVSKQMNYAVSYAITGEHFRVHTKPRIEQMMQDIREEFNRMVHETNWMDEATKNVAMNKSKAMQRFIALPDWTLDSVKLENYYKELQIEEENNHLENLVNTMEFRIKRGLLSLPEEKKRIWYLVELTKVNAYYVPAQNAMIIPMAFIQYPSYFLGMEALNYGAIGFVIGHELTHGFDETGRQYDEFGRKKLWWSNHTQQEYKNRSNCLVEQYSKYFVPEVGKNIDGNLTLDENIADNGGLREAFRAYRTYLKRYGPEASLVGFEKFSHEQLFFMSFGHSYCGTISSAEEILKDEHSPGKFRVNGVLSNMPEFSKAFQCAAGRRMNPEKKCRVW